LCLSPAINISGSTIFECDGATGNDACAATFPVAEDGSIPDDVGSFPKVLEWRQCSAETESFAGCEDDNDLDDQSWENPFDISKGHRGFLDGDYVMMMYAWSPNWKANSVGNDHYNLYVRRSFDGGVTWTTTPAALGGVGTTATENYCVSTSSEECVGTEFTYEAGVFEQGRNVSQLIGNKITILDPRYSPTGGAKLYPTIRTDWLETNIGAPSELLPYPDDLERDSSKFFMIYETGDNTTVDVGEAVPLDLYYSRATVYGDIWELDPLWYDEETGEIEDYRWPWLENKLELLSGEASMLANPGGTFMYTVWNQWQELEDETVFDSDIWFRRLLYQPDDIEMVVIASSSAIEVEEDLILEGQATSSSGIVEITWTHTFDNVTTILGHDPQLVIPGGSLQPGWHQFGFKSLNKQGYEEEEVLTVLVAESLIKYYLPMLAKTESPSADIVYVSSSSIFVDEELVLVGQAVAPEGSEIVEVLWTHTYNGVTTEVGSDLVLRMQPGNLHPGWQQFNFSGKDKEGRWSPGISVMILVVDE
jgi:hypothetical protein